MSPFQDLVKQNTHFVWNQSLENGFNQSKQITVGLVKKGITTFDTNRVTCLGLDYSKKHGFSAITEALQMPHQDDPGVQLSGLAHCICRQMQNADMNPLTVKQLQLPRYKKMSHNYYGLP